VPGNRPHNHHAADRTTDTASSIRASCAVDNSIGLGDGEREQQSDYRKSHFQFLPEVKQINEPPNIVISDYDFDRAFYFEIWMPRSALILSKTSPMAWMIFSSG
jgi:hypothetical protein